MTDQEPQAGENLEITITFTDVPVTTRQERERLLQVIVEAANLAGRKFLEKYGGTNEKMNGRDE